MVTKLIRIFLIIINLSISLNLLAQVVVSNEDTNYTDGENLILMYTEFPSIKSVSHRYIYVKENAPPSKVIFIVSISSEGNIEDIKYLPRGTTITDTLAFYEYIEAIEFRPAFLNNEPRPFKEYILIFTMKDKYRLKDEWMTSYTLNHRIKKNQIRNKGNNAISY